MSSYPTSPAYSFPVTRRLEFATQILAGRDGTEQRWMTHAGRESWDLAYPRMGLAERDTLLSFFDASLGAGAEGIGFTLLGAAFTGCYFAGDTLSFTESDPTYYAGVVKLAQVVRAPDAGAVPSNFPLLANGCPMQRPYTHAHVWDTAAVQTEGGRYVRSNRTIPLRTWTAGGSAITMAEAQAIWDMFRFCRGRYHSFTFTDPDSGTQYTNCRFGADKLEWLMPEGGHSSIRVTIAQVP